MGGGFADAAAGACCVYVSTYAGDADAVAFYTHIGFKTVAEHPGLNGPDDRGQVFMLKELGQPSTPAKPEGRADAPSGSAEA